MQRFCVYKLKITCPEAQDCKKTLKGIFTYRGTRDNEKLRAKWRSLWGLKDYFEGLGGFFGFISWVFLCSLKNES